MKLAKKMLACVIALALIGCFAINAFAAEPTITVVAGEIEDGAIPVTIVFNNAIGLTSCDLKLAYKTADLAYDGDELGADAQNVADTTKNTVSCLCNEDVKGEVLVAFNFLNSLTTVADAEAKRGKTPAYNEAKFEAVVVYLKVTGDASKTDITLTGSFKTLANTDGIAVNAPLAITLKETPTTAAPTTAAPTTAPTSDIPDTGDEPSTGDNMALAAAAGVILLAGAAFVITKKRK